MSEIVSILSANFMLSAIMFGALWLLALHLRDPSFIDSWWALGIVVLTAATFVKARGHGPHALVLASVGVIWGLRLGLYLLWRWFKHGHDRRYEKLVVSAHKKHGWRFGRTALLWIFGPQMAMQFIVALPVMLGQIPETQSLGPFAIAGAALALFGIAYEAIADAQLTRFKSNAENKGKVMDRGLWRYSRHPNYFGELCTWWGAYLVAAETGLGAFSLPGPLLLTFLLTRVSGAPTTEPHLQKTRPDYEAYKARTSAFIPLPPKGQPQR